MIDITILADSPSSARGIDHSCMGSGASRTAPAADQGAHHQGLGQRGPVPKSGRPERGVPRITRADKEEYRIWDTGTLFASIKKKIIRNRYLYKRVYPLLSHVPGPTHSLKSNLPSVCGLFSPHWIFLIGTGVFVGGELPCRTA
jgi:hypothetical protein